MDVAQTDPPLTIRALDFCSHPLLTLESANRALRIQRLAVVVHYKQ
jgi:hypothetical protein